MKPAGVALVTGASGLVGAALVRRLLLLGYRVRAFSRSRPRVEIESEQAGVRYEWVSGDLLNRQRLEPLCAGADVVFHTAALVDDWGSPESFWATNCQATQHLVEAARTTGVGRFVHLSTVDVFGFSRNERVDERHPRIGYPHPYSESKLAGEACVWEAAAKGLAVSVVYPTWIFGPGDRHLLPTLLAMLQTGPVLELDRGRPHFEATYCDNLADACILIAICEHAAGEGYIVGDGYDVNLGEFFGAVAQAAGLRPSKLALPIGLALGLASAVEAGYRVARPRTRPPLTRYALCALANGARYDLSKVRALGYNPRVDFETAIRAATVDALRGLRGDAAAL